LPQDRDEESEAFLAEVCWHYFINELTQSEIAKALGVTRLRVNRAIQQAKASGLVRVELNTPFQARLELQQQLCRTLGLRRACVAVANRQAYDYHQPVGAALASFLDRGLKEEKWKSIGVAWGLTLEAAIRRLPTLSLPDIEIVSIMGGTTTGATFNTFGVASGFAQKLGARYSVFAAPIYLAPSADKDIFLSDTVFREHLDRCHALDLAILVASDLSKKSFLVQYGLPASVTPEDLAAHGAVGDLLGRFVNSSGRLIDHPINQWTVGLELEQLPNIPEVVLAAAGPHKVDIILATARRGLFSTLITDDVTAELILERLQ
jgi:DNA-binding transcriptional regulator LsrR (DeoR family)